MDKKFLTENNMLEAYAEFSRICAGSGDKFLTEAGPLDMGNEDETPEMPETGEEEMPQGPEMGGEGDENDPFGGIEPGSEDNTEAMDDMDLDGLGMEEEDTLQSDDVVIDVDDITNAQEEMNDKVNAIGKNLGKVDQRIEDLFMAVDKITKRIDSNNQEIEKFKAEFEKRNPTPTEKLNLRSLDSYPFNVTPEEFWKGKMGNSNSNYEIYADNSEPVAKTYEITVDDIDKVDNASVVDSFMDDDDDQDLRKIFQNYIK